MSASKNSVRVAAMALLLLVCLVPKAYAGELDSIFGGVAYIVGGGLTLLLAGAGFVAILNRKSPPGALLALLAGLLALPLQAAWLFWTALSHPSAWVSYLLFALPTVALGVGLWNGPRRNLGWATGASALLVALLSAGQVASYQQSNALHGGYGNGARTGAVEVPAGVENSPDATRVLDHAEQMPTFYGGPDSVRARLQRRVHYPELAQADQIAGRVRLRYVVGIDGRVYGPEVTQGMGGGAFDNEALRAVQELVFEPARQKGEIVAVYDTISVVFKKPAAKRW